MSLFALDLVFESLFVQIRRRDGSIKELCSTHLQVLICFSHRLLFTFYYFSLCRKITELEEELRVVGNNMKSLEVSEQEVLLVTTPFDDIKLTRCITFKQLFHDRALATKATQPRTLTNDKPLLLLVTFAIFLH